MNTYKKTHKPLNLFFDGIKRKRVSASHNIIIDDSVDFGEGVIINYGCNRNTIIENDVWIGHKCVIGHDVIVREHTVLGVGVIVSGEVEIDRCSFIAGGTFIHPKKYIGKNTMVGSCSNVTKDIPGFKIAYGNPCKVIRDNKWEHPAL